MSGRAEDMKPEERDRRTLARRIVKAIEPLFEDATRKEAELNGRPYAQQIREMDEALLSRRGSLAESVEIPVLDSVESKQETGIASPEDRDVEMLDVATASEEKSLGQETTQNTQALTDKTELFKQDGLRTGAGMMSADTPPASTNGFKPEQQTNGEASMRHSQQVEPPTPPMSLEGHSQNVPCEGGVPWYVAQFDPEGTTIFEERWTGPEVLRDMSEELSEMDEDELQGLGPGDDMSEDINGTGAGDGMDAPPTADSMIKKKTSKKGGKRGRNSEWGARSFRNRR